MGIFTYSRVDFIFTYLGLLFLLLDIGLDIWAVVTFYQEKAHVCLGLLLLFLLGSSALVQAFSWLWYSYDDFERHTSVEKLPSQFQLGLLHLLQLGIYLRHAGLLEISVRSFCGKGHGPHGDWAVFLSHDLSILRLIESFSESAPQLVLMLAVLLQRGQLSAAAALKALGSASAIALSMTMYHRMLRSFLPEKQQQSAASSVVYFLWNLVIIGARLSALALFASLLPCFILVHFCCSWLLLFFCAWRAQTDFMSGGGEWLYRATVGLIWYFVWFNVVAGRTRFRTLLYHGYMLADISLLCAVWCWRMTIADPEWPGGELSPFYAIVMAVTVVMAYVLGLLLKMAYYKWWHPNVLKEELKGNQEDGSGQDETDSKEDVVFRNTCPSPQKMQCNKRIKVLVENFYT